MGNSHTYLILSEVLRFRGWLLLSSVEDKQKPFILIFKKVWNIFFILFFAKSTFTTVTGNVGTVAGETVDG